VAVSFIGGETCILKRKKGKICLENIRRIKERE
jgi:hypothetical protein